MSEQISILKLMDGTTIVGKVSNDGDLVEIEHPIELVPHVEPMAGILGEAISLRPWVAIAEENIFSIERYNVINISTLQEQFVDGYERMVEQIYFREATWRGSLVDPAPPEEEQVLDADTMTELADAIIKGKIH
jgi:hypothetical protein